MAIDYTKFNSNGDTDQAQQFNKYWWKSRSDTELAQSINSVVSAMGEWDSKRQTQYQMSSRLYGNSDLMGVSGLSFTKTNRSNAPLRDRISYNIIQSAIDTVTAKIAKNKPKPLFLTSGGDWEMQRKAKKLTKFTEGVFYENNTSKNSPIIFRDGCIFGTGVTHVYAEHGKIKHERVLASELYVDWMDAMYGQPRQMHRVKNVARSVMLEKFPDKASKIRNINAASTGLVGHVQQVTDEITVVESWHLPSGPDASDGLHVISTGDDTVLFKEKWKHSYFPFAFFKWSEPTLGFWGMGLAEQIQNIQLEVNKLLWVIQRSMHLAGSFKIFIENSSKIVKEHLSNDLGTIVAYTGTQPTYLTPPIVAPEVYAHLLTLKNAAYEQAGISQLSASSQKPAGLNSGKALREYNDIETERFMVVGQAYEDYHLQLARLDTMVGKEIYKENKDFSVKVPGKKFIESIPWKRVDMEDDEFILKMYPISSLPSDPEGRLQTVQEYVQAGMYSPRVAKRLLDFPDLEAIDDGQGAEEDYLHSILERMIEQEDDVDEEGRPAYTPPDPYDNLTLAQELSLEYIAQGKRDRLPEVLMERLRLFNEQVQELITKSVPPPAPMPMPGDPQALPMAPPQSDLIPNLPQVA